MERLRRIGGHLAALPASSAAVELPPVLTLGEGTVSAASGKLGLLRESTMGLGGEELRRRMELDGYLLIRGLIPSNILREAYAAARGVLESEGTWPGGKFSASWRSCEPVMRALEAPPLRRACETLFWGEAAASFPFKWVRTSQPGQATDFHVDNVYMNRGSNRLITAWVPLEDVPFEKSPLCLLERSHSLPGFELFRQTYTEHDWQDSKIIGNGGLYSKDPWEMLAMDENARLVPFPFPPPANRSCAHLLHPPVHNCCRWLTSEFRLGDALLLGMKTVHGAVKNTSAETRLSFDVRWQPLNDLWDDRYVSGGNSSWPGVDFVVGADAAKIDLAVLPPDTDEGSLTLSEMKDEWGLPH